jgi:hypothetical protein
MKTRDADHDEADDLEEVTEQDQVPPGWRPSQETTRAIEGQPDTPEQTIHYHHIYPAFRGNEEYSSFFTNLEIDVDQWTVACDEATHQRYIHVEAAWNNTWKAWIDEHRGEVTAEETLAFGRRLLTHYGLEGLWEGDADPQPSYDIPEGEVHRKPAKSQERR